MSRGETESKTETMNMSWPFRLWIILACGIGYRLSFIDRPIAGDEVGSALWYVKYPVYSIMANYSMPKNHIFQSILSHFTFTWFGYSEWALRLPVFVAGVLVIPLTYIVALKIIEDKRVALLAATFSAVSGYLIKYSTVGRGYAIQAFLVLALCWIGRTTVRSWSVIVLAFTGFLLLYVMPSGINFLVPFYIALWLHTKNLRTEIAQAVVVTVALTTLAYLPLWPSLTAFSRGEMGAGIVQGVPIFLNEVVGELSRGILPSGFLLGFMAVGAYVFPWLAFIVCGYLVFGMATNATYPFLSFLPRNYGILYPLAYILAAIGIAQCYRWIKDLRYQRYFWAGFTGLFVISATHELLMRDEMPYDLGNIAQKDCRDLVKSYAKNLREGDYLRGLGPCDGVGQWYAEAVQGPPPTKDIRAVYLVSDKFEYVQDFYKKAGFPPQVKPPHCFKRNGIAMLCSIQ